MSPAGTLTTCVVKRWCTVSQDSLNRLFTIEVINLRIESACSKGRKSMLDWRTTMVTQETCLRRIKQSSI